VPDDAVVLLPNVHIIGEVNLDDSDNFLASQDLVDYAIKRGWFDPEGDEPFHFRKAYCHERDTHPDPRQSRGQELVTGRTMPRSPNEHLPFAVKPAKKLTVADVIEILRDRGGSPLISNRSTQEAAVFQLRAQMPREIGCVYWRTTAEPSVSVLTPWYLGTTETPKAYYLPTEVETQLSLDHHFSPPPGTFDARPNLAWWTFFTLQQAVHEDYENRIKRVRPVWETFEKGEFRQQRNVEERALRRLQADPEAAHAYLAQYCAELALKACREADRLRATLKSATPKPN
jgi:dipeptidase